MPEDRPERFILVINHRADQADTIKQVLSNPPDQYHVHIAESSALALALLQSPAASRPDLILLDLNLPNQEGLMILTTLKSSDDLRRIPVIVLSDSDQTGDVFQSYSNQGNCYVIKNADLHQLATTIQKIESFWLEIVTLPT
ncbi:MAG: hypothetical protein RLZZ597_444 [Cyanobacteriota bacterium]